MSAAAESLDQLVTAMVPSLSRSLTEQFNVFRVMHHGTHEKQLSNVFAWLLNASGTHDLGEAFQRIFVAHVNRSLPSTSHVPAGGYRVTQEVDTAGQQGAAADIADIVLAHERASIVIENFEWSDGHGHSYENYFAHGAAGGRQSVVVLLCVRHLPHLQANGWEKAVVLTYGNLLKDLQEHLEGDRAWRRGHPRQAFFINELVDHFVEGPGAVSVEDRIGFIEAMCRTGESARYGYRPHEVAAQEFADLVALHAKQQFEAGRKTLAEVKRMLKRFAENSLVPQLNAHLTVGPVTKVQTPFAGQWEWSVALRRDKRHVDAFLEFGPTAVVENRLVPDPVPEPDYTRVFVTRQAADGEGVDRIVQTDVSLADVLNGVSTDDTRLRDTVIALLTS